VSKATTQLWKPMFGAAHGQIARGLEESRRLRWNDSAYVQEEYYGLSLRGVAGPDQTMGADGETTFIFPVGPQSVRSSREYRQNVSPTLGGVIAEELGLLWVDFTIEGNFGLSPKYGYDNTKAVVDRQKVTKPWKSPLSGPKWTQRMFEHFLDRYAICKSRPDENAQTTLVFHNFKDDEHWIVVPVKVELNRTLADRFMYPFSITLRGIQRTGPVKVKKRPPAIVHLISGIQNSTRSARIAVGSITDASDTISDALGSIRSYVSTVDNILDEASRALVAVSTLLDAHKRLPDLGRATLQSYVSVIENALIVADKAEYFPQDVRKSLRDLVDTYDALSAQPMFQSGSTWGERVNRAENNQRSGGLDKGTTPRNYSTDSVTGWTSYVVEAGDTLESIAARKLGTATRWYELAVCAGLKAPFISDSGLPGTAGVGDTIRVPAYTSAKKTGTLSALQGASPLELYGADIKLYETNGSEPGNPMVDIKIDPATGRDVAVIGAIPNLVQACQMRLWTEQGTQLLDPSYGTPFVVGYPSEGSTIVALRQAVRSGLTGDSRIDRIQSMIVVAEGDMLDVEADVIPVGIDTVVKVGVSLI